MCKFKPCDCGFCYGVHGQFEKNKKQTEVGKMEKCGYCGAPNHAGRYRRDLLPLVEPYSSQKDQRITDLEAQLAESKLQFDKDSIMLKEYHYLISDETLSLNDKLIRFDSLDEEVRQWAEAEATEGS